MDELKVCFRFGAISFQEKEDLTVLHLEKVKELVLSWEQELMESSALYFLKKELQMNLDEIIKVSVHNKKESQPIIG